MDVSVRIYTEEELIEISRMSGLNFRPDEIATYLKIDKNIFASDLKYCEVVKDAYKRGKIEMEIEQREAATKSPRLLKELREIEAEREYKDMVNDLYDFPEPSDKRRTNYYDRLISYGSNEIARYKKTGQSEVIREMDQKYIEYISFAAQVFNRNQTITYCANRMCEMFPEVDHNMAKKYIYDAINYFHLNHTVSNKAWDTFFALEELPKLKELALRKGNLDLVQKIVSQQHEILTRHPDQTFTEEDLKVKPQLITPDITLERLGVKKLDLKTLWFESMKLVDEFNIEKVDKDRIKKELSSELNYTEPENE